MKLTIDYFTDVLCIWAYGADIRIQELQQNFADDIEIRYRFVNLFGTALTRIESGWQDQGGFTGFNQHVHKVAANWEHVGVHPHLWLQDAPASAIPAHLFLHAVKLYLLHEQPERLDDSSFHAIVSSVRTAFFQDCRNISRADVLREIADELGVSWEGMQKYMQDGRSHAVLQQDQELANQLHVDGSPTLVFNEGRQKLYGNLGYRVIEANIRELLRDPGQGEATWC